jgi:hypothetical protein
MPRAGRISFCGEVVVCVVCVRVVDVEVEVRSGGDVAMDGDECYHVPVRFLNPEP